MPLGLGLVSAAVFLGIVLYLLSTLRWIEHTEQVLASANRVSRLAADMESSVRGYLIAGDESFLVPYQTSKPQFVSAVSELAGMVADNPPQVERLRRVAPAFDAWDRFAGDAIAIKRGQGDYVAPVRAGRGKSQMDQMRSELASFIDTEERLRQIRSDTGKTATTVLVILYLLLSLGLSALLALLGRRELIGLSETYEASLGDQRAHNALLAQTAWIRTGESELGARTSAAAALAPMADALLDFVTSYVDGAVAALYVREDHGGLRRVATYGFQRGDDTAAQAAPATPDGNPAAPGRMLHPRESLVGQAAHENRIIRLDDVPAHYMQVSSGLGAAPPRHLVIVPLMTEGRVNSVIEIGFLHAVAPRTLEFLAAVNDNIAAALHAALQRERLQDLLTETQQLNEEMQVQQEELRVSNEELAEQSHALEQSQARLEHQQAELEQTNEELVAQASALDQRNEALDLARRELEERAGALERVSKYKSEFLANMSHELRTPLNSSLILAKLLSDNPSGNLDVEQVRFAQTIYAAGNDLLDLINDILDIAKVEAGKLDLSLEHVPVNRIVQSLAVTFEPMAADKNLGFSVEVAPDLPATLHTDRQRIEQILKNLLSNAFKFTEAGTVALRVAKGEGARVRFTVADSGIGIAPEHQESIFEAFSQADGTTSRRFGGTGLGLSISRDLAHLLGGVISMQSTPGIGSQFSVEFPVDHFDADADPESDQVGAAGRPSAVASSPAGMRSHESSALASGGSAGSRAPGADAHVPRVPAVLPFTDDRQADNTDSRVVLVIEDDPIFARLLFDLAHDMDYRCLVALSAEEALTMAQDYRVDAILLDLGLPDRSGLSVLQELKNTPATRHIAVHIISGAEQAAEALNLGAVGFARKPATREQLHQVFEKLEARLSQKIKRLLLVEDDPVQRESMVALIADVDIDIVAVDSGEQALHALRSTVFDCMVIDLNLPDMLGGQLLERMAGEVICSFPPVIVYTGRNLSRDEEGDLMRYSRSIIIKGARSPERLLDEVTLFLHKVEDQLSPDRQHMIKAVRGRDRVFEGRTVLLVDDDVRNVFALTSALEQLGLRVEIARTGIEAISQVDKLSAIDLVLMDVMMPGMDGLEATRRIRLDPRFKHLPIVAVTAKATRSDHEQCLAAGASDYLAKPIDLARLNSLLRVWMPKLERL